MPREGVLAYLRGMLRPISRLALVIDILGAMLGFLLTVPFSTVFLGAGTSVSFWLTENWQGTGATLLVGAIMWIAAAVCRLSPPLALAIAWLGAIVQMATGLWPSFVDIPVYIALYATAAWGSRVVMWVGGASTVVGALSAGLYLTSVISLQRGGMAAEDVPQLLLIGVLLVIITILTLAMSWGAGLLWRLVLHTRAARAEQLRSEALAVEEQERVRIARDMHDVVAHSLAVVIAQADGARYAAAVDPEATQEALGTIAQTARGALSDVRMLLTQLRHRQGDGPQPTLADLEALFAHVRQAGIEPRVTVDPLPPGEPPAAVQLAVYRILQEALTNALRHGMGDVDIRLSWWPDRVDLEVRNATAERPSTSGGGHGIIGMRERAQLVGGTVEARHDAGTFVVRATLPIGGLQDGGAE